MTDRPHETTGTNHEKDPDGSASMSMLGLPLADEQVRRSSLLRNSARLSDRSSPLSDGRGRSPRSDASKRRRVANDGQYTDAKDSSTTRLVELGPPCPLFP